MNATSSRNSILEVDSVGEDGRLSSGEDTSEYEDWEKVGEWEAEGGTRSEENGVLERGDVRACWEKIYSKLGSNSNFDSTFSFGFILLCDLILY